MTVLITTTDNVEGKRIARYLGIVTGEASAEVNLVSDKPVTGFADSYHKVLFDKALEIMSKPAEVQESLAKAVLETNYLESQSTSSGSSTTETRLGNLGTTVPAGKEIKPQESTSSVAGTFTETLGRVVSSLGRGGRL